MQVNVPLSFEFWVSQLASFKQRGDEVAEWLRRWTANPLGSARAGSNPVIVAFLRGISSNGRAPALHAGGRGIDALILHIIYYNIFLTFNYTC